MNRVFVLGNATVDIIQQMQCFPNPGETVLASTSLRCAGGKGLNQAVAAARTGASVSLAAPVGHDNDATFLAESVLEEADLCVDWLLSPAGTDLSVIWINGSGENVIVSSADCALSLQPTQSRNLCSVLEAGDLLVLQGNLSLAATLAAAEVARACGARTILNTAPIAWDMTSVLRLVDILIANEGEAAFLSQGAHDPAKALHAIGVPVVIVTLGPEGARIVHHEYDAILPAPIVLAIDTAGAGDVFTGTLAGFLAQGVDMISATTIAVAAASQSVTQSGTTPSFPSREAIRNLFDLIPQVSHA
jgi:ribokinase